MIGLGSFAGFTFAYTSIIIMEAVTIALVNAKQNRKEEFWDAISVVCMKGGETNYV